MMDSSRHATDVTNSAAFQFLESCVESGRLTHEEAAAYRAKYQQLHEAVIHAYAADTALVNRGKQLKATQDTFKAACHELEKSLADAREAKEVAWRELANTRQEKLDLGDQQSEVNWQLGELKADMDTKLRILEEMRQDFERKLSPEKEALESKVDMMSAELKDEKAKNQKDEAALLEMEKALEECDADILQKEHEKHSNRMALQKLSLLPEKERRDADMVEKGLMQIQSECDKLNKEIARLTEKQESLLERRAGLEHLRADLMATENNLEIENGTLQQRHLDLERDVADQMKEAHEAQLKLDKIDVREAVLREEKRRVKYHFEEQHKLYEQWKKKCEQLRRKRDMIKSIIPPLKDQEVTLKQQIEEMSDLYKERQKQLEEFNDDKDLFMKQLIDQDVLEKSQKSLLEGIKAQVEAFEAKIKDEVDEERKLRGKILSEETERERMAREASRMTTIARETEEGLKLQDLILLDMEKHYRQTEEKLERCGDEFKVVKNQLNKSAHQSQGLAQSLAEMREKIKILENEVDILRNESVGLDRALGEEKRKHMDDQNARDALRIEGNKQQNELGKKENELKRQDDECNKLNSIVDRTEREMVALRKNYSVAVDMRNLTGIQLIDRNDELCILYEKKNIQDSILAQGQAAVAKLEQEAHILQLQKLELTRSLNVARSQLPSADQWTRARAELAKVQKELAQERKTMEELTGKLESGDTSMGASEQTSRARGLDVKQVQRARQLGGMDGEPDRLQDKVDKLQERLNDKKEQLLEKELVLDEVTSLAEKLALQAAENRRPTLELAQQVSTYQSKIRGLTRKMMATVSELSMYQATAMKMEQERVEKESLLKRARHRMQKGYPPTEDADAEWERRERDRLGREEAIANRRMELEERKTWEAASGQPQNAQAVIMTRTTAEPRPNAYIPDDLGIPKPYGGRLAPFKPTPLGANLRHIKKPITKEIEL